MPVADEEAGDGIVVEEAPEEDGAGQGALKDDAVGVGQEVAAAAAPESLEIDDQAELTQQQDNVNLHAATAVVGLYGTSDASRARRGRRYGKVKSKAEGKRMESLGVYLQVINFQSQVTYSILFMLRVQKSSFPRLAIGWFRRFSLLLNICRWHFC